MKLILVLIDNGDTLSEWTPETQGAYLHDLIYYKEDGHVRITVSGYYYIYCQVSQLCKQREC